MLKRIIDICLLIIIGTAPTAAQEADSAAVDTSDAVLEAELEQMLAEPEYTPQAPAPAASYAGFKNMNPNIGIIAKFTADALVEGELEAETGAGDEHGHRDGGMREGFTFHEMELSFQMVIDPYARADFFVAVVPPEEAVHLEEGYLTLLSLPLDMKAKLGVFRSTFGRLNRIHPPEIAFADYPLPIESYFGDEGLVETGVSLSWLLPNPWDLFWEGTLEVTNGDNAVAFNGNTTNDLAYTGHLTTFYDLGENTTLELGGSLAKGVHDDAGELGSNVFGGDLTLKWKPLRRGLYRSFTWQAEYIRSEKKDPCDCWNVADGWYSYVRWQLGRRWFVSGRYDIVEPPAEPGESENRTAAALTFFPSEFQTIRLQATRSEDHRGESNTMLTLQWNFVIGTHGAHAY